GSGHAPPSWASPAASARSPRGREPQRIGMLRPSAIRTVDPLDERGRAGRPPAGPTFDGHQTLPEPGRLDLTGSTRAARAAERAVANGSSHLTSPLSPLAVASRVVRRAMEPAALHTRRPLHRLDDPLEL